MWQIGVDILAQYQGLGIGKAVVGTVTQALWKREIIPYYSTTVSHLQSRQVVSRLGYWAAWIESYTKDAEGRDTRFSAGREAVSFLTSSKTTWTGLL